MFELRLRCAEDHVETLSEALEAAGSQSVSIEDAEAGSTGERALFGEPGMAPAQPAWPNSRMSALFFTRQDASRALRDLESLPLAPVCRVIGIHELPDQDWVRLTQSQFDPVEIAPDFWIVPSWHEPPAAARRIIRLDPGLAFGTGTHPTTRMCLRFIAERPNRFRRVLDYGCGSGILAIGAALYGATDIDAVDVDQAAVDSTIANAADNRVNIRAGFPDVADGQYDLVLANILASPLKVLAPLLCSKVAPGGGLVLAGVLERQAEELTRAYAPHALLAPTGTMEGWVLMTAAF